MSESTILFSIAAAILLVVLWGILCLAIAHNRIGRRDEDEW